MVILVSKIKQRKTNRFMTDEEACIAWQESRCYPKLHLMIGFGLFRGMRIGEICAINLRDFQNSEFNKINIILEKSHIMDEFPLLQEFSKEVREYVHKNVHLMKNGFLFPYYSSTRKLLYMHPETAGALLCKMRKKIGKKYPAFLERQEIHSDKGVQYRYRISWHTFRRWFETRVWERYKDKMQLRDVMRYQSSETVDTYINPYETWKKEREILQTTFGDLFQNFNDVGKGQSKLSDFI